MANRIDAAMQAMQPAGAQSPLDPRSGEAERDQLRMRDDPMLARRQFCHAHLTRRMLWSHIDLNLRFGGDGAQGGRRIRAKPDAAASLRRQACEQTLERGAQDRALELRVGCPELLQHQTRDGRNDEAGVRLRVV